MAILQDSGVVSLQDTPSAILRIFNRNATNSPLLRLPAELRLRIYDLVVSAPRQWVFIVQHGEGVFTSSHRKHLIEANVLQRVCKTTRSETRRLEFKNNTVKINEDIFALLTLSDNWRLQHFKGVLELRNVHGVSLHPNPTLLYDVIFKFARENPKATIRIIVPSWDFRKKSSPFRYFLCLGWMIERVVRKRKTPKFRGMEGAMCHWYGGRGQRNYKNLTFHPASLDFQEERMRRLIQGPDREFVRNVALITYADEEELVEAVRGWYKNGI